MCPLAPVVRKRKSHVPETKEEAAAAVLSLPSAPTGCCCLDIVKRAVADLYGRTVAGRHRSDALEGKRRDQLFPPWTFSSLARALSLSQLADSSLYILRQHTQTHSERHA